MAVRERSREFIVGENRSFGDKLFHVLEGMLDQPVDIGHRGKL